MMWSPFFQPTCRRSSCPRRTRCVAFHSALTAGRWSRRRRSCRSRCRDPPRAGRSSSPAGRPCRHAEPGLGRDGDDSRICSMRCLWERGRRLPRPVKCWTMRRFAPFPPDGSASIAWSSEVRTTIRTSTRTIEPVVRTIRVFLRKTFFQIRRRYFIRSSFGRSASRSRSAPRSGGSPCRGGPSGARAPPPWGRA